MFTRKVFKGNFFLIRVWRIEFRGEKWMGWKTQSQCAKIKGNLGAKQRVSERGLIFLWHFMYRSISYLGLSNNTHRYSSAGQFFCWSHRSHSCVQFDSLGSLTRARKLKMGSKACLADSAGWSRGPQLEKLVCTSCGLSFSSRFQWTFFMGWSQGSIPKRETKSWKPSWD